MNCQHRLNRYIDVYAGKSIVDWKSALRLIGIDPGYTVAPAHKVDDEMYNAFLEKLKANGSYDLIVK